MGRANHRIPGAVQDAHDRRDGLRSKYWIDVRLIERHLGAKFPSEAIGDVVVFDTGSRQRTYTDEQTVMPSGRADYQGLASLEMLYHEASHTTVTAALEAAIETRLKATGRKEESDLWHVAQFYTVGAVTRDVLARRGQLVYQTYADKRGLYAGYWAPLMPAVDAVWRLHMEGKLDLQEAATQMVDRFTSAISLAPAMRAKGASTYAPWRTEYLRCGGARSRARERKQQRNLFSTLSIP